MERRAVFLSSTLFALIISACLYSCSDGQPGSRVKVPGTYRRTSDAGFCKKQDTLYCVGAKYSGYAYELSDEGDTLLVAGYVDGLEEGALKKWYPNRQLQELRYYAHGQKNGMHRGWWENGNKKFEFHIVDDFYEGNFKEWNHAGLLIKDFNYVHGQEQGSEKLWWDDGTIRANYVVDNGKKYGLIGLKICRNIYDSTK